MREGVHVVVVVGAVGDECACESAVLLVRHLIIDYGWTNFDIISGHIDQIFQIMEPSLDVVQLYQKM